MPEGCDATFVLIQIGPTLNRARERYSGIGFFHFHSNCFKHRCDHLEKQRKTVLVTLLDGWALAYPTF